MYVNHAKEADRQSEKKTEPDQPKDPEALTSIRNEITKDLDNREYKTAYVKAEKALQGFSEDTTLKNLREKARVHLAETYSVLLKEGDILLKGDNLEDAREVYEKCKSAVIPEFSQKAEEKIKELNALIEKRKTVKREGEAKKLYLNCSFYFNDFMDEEPDYYGETRVYHLLAFMRDLGRHGASGLRRNLIGQQPT